MDKLALEAGVSKGTVDKYETEGESWQEVKMKAIAKALGVTLDALTNDSVQLPSWAKISNPKRKRSTASKSDRLVDDTDEQSTDLTGIQASTNIGADISFLGPRTRVSAYLGGSAKPFMMSSDRVEVVEVPFQIGDEHIVVVASDGTLKPATTPGTTLIFRKIARPADVALLLIGKIGTENEFAIRHFDSDADDGHGAFIDKRGVLPPLSRDEWEVRGMLFAKAAESGLAE